MTDINKINAEFLEATRKYSNYIDKHSGWEVSCSGIGDCEDCNKGLYPLRTVYLKAYIRRYKTCILFCPPLHWIAADTAKKYNAGAFHKEKCAWDKSIAECECDLANFMKVAYPNIREDSILSSFGDQIYPNFIRTAV